MNYRSARNIFLIITALVIIFSLIFIFAPQRGPSEGDIDNCLGSNKDMLIGKWIQQPTYTSNIYALNLYDDTNFELSIREVDNSSLKGEWNLIHDNSSQFILLKFKQLNTFWKEILDYYQTNKSEYYLVDYDSKTIKVKISLENANNPKELKCEKEYLQINFLNNTLVRADVIDISDINLNFELAIENYTGQCKNFMKEFQGSSKWYFDNFYLDLVNNNRFVLYTLSDEYIDPEKLEGMTIEGEWTYEGEEVVLNIESSKSIAPEIYENIEEGGKIRLALNTSDSCTINDLGLFLNNNIIFKPVTSEFTIF